MKNSIIKFFLTLFILVFCIIIFQKIQISETTTTDYWSDEEMTILYLYYIK